MQKTLELLRMLEATENYCEMTFNKFSFLNLPGFTMVFTADYHGFTGLYSCTILLPRFAMALLGFTMVLLDFSMPS